MDIIIASIVIALPATLLLVWVMTRSRHASPGSVLLVPDQLREALDALSEGLALVDQDQKVLYANKSLARALEMDAAATVGRSIDELFGCGGSLLQLIAESKSVAAPLSMTGPRLSGKTYDLTASPLASDASPFAAILVRDVTDQRRYESQLLQNEKLAAVGQLVAGVAHELNNPLSAIAAMSDFLLERPDTPEDDAKPLQLIHEQAVRASEIVKNLLDFARAGSGVRQAVDLNEVVERTVQFVSHELRLRRVLCEVSLHPDLPRIMADRSRIQQVVLNLLTNAYQALGEVDNPVIRVQTSVRDQAAIMRVSDNGPGVPAATSSEIFQPFFTTKDSGFGTGLGLSISHDIVAEFGGTITLNSESGNTSFEVSLPAVSSDDVEAAKTGSAHAQQHQGKDSLSGSGRQVLLIDDDPAVREVLNIIFQDRGLPVTTARDSEHAFEVLDQKKIELIVADASSAAPNGITFAEQLPKDHPGLVSSTLIMTGDVRKETNDRLGALGYRYIHKPFDIKELTNAIEDLLVQRSGASASIKKK